MPHLRMIGFGGLMMQQYLGKKCEAADSIEMPNHNGIAGEQAAERATVCLAPNSGRRGPARIRGLAMITEYDQSDKTADYHHHPAAMPGADPEPMTPEAARRLAAILAPHLVAMRAVTAGTRYAEAGSSTADDVRSGSAAPAISPATRIFISGMLQRIPL
jgi:hypothetical protein